MSTPRTHRARWATLTSALALGLGLLSGCGFGGVYDMPLPGGADVGSNPMRITVDFDDVVDLVPQSSVKVSNIAVGRVSNIQLNPDGLTAKVTLIVRNDLDLPATTTARLQQSSLLGEKYIALIRPTTNTNTTGSGDQSGGMLHTGSHIGIAATSQVAEVEQVLGAVSTVLNGGGIGRFQEISRELQKVSAGRPEQIKEFLDTTRAFVAGLDARKDAIASALDSLKDLSETLNNDKDKIAVALEGLNPGMQVLVDQREQLVSMLGSLDKLSEVTTRTLNASQKEMIEDFKLLEPILDNLAKAGSALPQSLQALFTYPFPDAVLSAIKGDYLNAFVLTNYTTLPAGCAAMGCPWDQIPDDGHMPPIDPFAGGGTGGGSAPSAGEAKTTQTTTPSTSPASPFASSSPSAGAASPSAASGASSPPSPALLPPTDSPLPGIITPTIQVPVSPSPSPDSASSLEEN